MEYFNGLLNSTNIHSEEEAKPDDFGLGSLIIWVKVTEVVKQLRSGSAPGVDEIRSELLKDFWLSCLTCICNIAWT